MKTLAIKLTETQMRNDSGREYNPAIWNQNIDRYLKFTDVEFYKIERNDLYDYNRYFVIYTTPSGVRFMNSFGYSSCLSNNGFVAVVVSNLDVNPDTLEYTILPENTFHMWTHQFNCNGKEVCLANTKEAHEWMAERSQKYGAIYTKESL